MIYLIVAFITLLACILYVSFSSSFENELDFESDLFGLDNDN
jgi:hypothetical protein